MGNLNHLARDKKDLQEDKIDVQDSQQQAFQIITQAQNNNSLIFLKEKTTGRQCVVRQFNANSNTDSQKLLSLLNQKKKILQNHLHILGIRQIFHKKQSTICADMFKVFAIVDRPLMTLAQQIRIRSGTLKYFKQAQIWIIFSTITQALKLLYQNGIKHQSLSSQKVYLNSAGVIQIGDPYVLGHQINPLVLSTPHQFFSSNDQYTGINFNCSNRAENIERNGFIQNIYLSPQQLEFMLNNPLLHYSSQNSDIFTLGMILLQCCNLKSLIECGVYQSNSTIINLKKLQKQISKTKQRYSHSLVNIIYKILRIQKLKKNQNNPLSTNITYNQIQTQVNQNLIIVNGSHISIQILSYKQPCKPKIYNFIPQTKLNILEQKPQMKEKDPLNKHQKKLSLIKNQNNQIQTLRLGGKKDRIINIQKQKTLEQKQKIFASQPRQIMKKCRLTCQNFITPVPIFKDISNSNIENTYINKNMIIHENIFPCSNKISNNVINFQNPYQTKLIYQNQIPTNQNNSRLNDLDLNIKESTKLNYNYPLISIAETPSTNNNQISNHNTFQKIQLENSHKIGLFLSVPEKNQDFLKKQVKNQQKQLNLYKPFGFSSLLDLGDTLKSRQLTEDQKQFLYKENIILESNNALFEKDIQNNQEKLSIKTQFYKQSTQYSPQEKLFSPNNFTQLKYQVQQYPYGSRYQGYKLAGLRHGFGKFSYQDGGYYQGQWKNGKMDGYAKLYYPNGQLAYQGYWKADSFHGRGKVFNDGVKMLKKNDFDYRDMGYLSEYWLWYDGNFSNDIKQGEGTIKFINGDIFEGSFKDDEVCGLGKFIKVDGEVIQGVWQQNKLVKIF